MFVSGEVFLLSLDKALLTGDRDLRHFRYHWNALRGIHLHYRYFVDKGYQEEGVEDSEGVGAVKG